ncbi:MAG: aminopeptidase P family protein [Thermoleophilia bacterium]|nr:aminopeptidase P family protein [Thermoleophilia bacterium]
MPDVLIIADTIRSPELRHEVPLAVPDPFFYAEVSGTRSVVVSSLESGRIADLGTDLQVLTYEDAGIDELLKRGLDTYALNRELYLGACRQLGLEAAATPGGFPLEYADHLRANGIELTADQPFFDGRRRVKNEHELAGIRRACRAVEAGVAAGVELLRSASRSNGVLMLGGEPLTCERIQLEVERAFGEHGAAAEEFIVSHGAQTAVGHEAGHGPVAADDVGLFDLFPRDRESACYSDFTRTFSLGPPSDELAEYHRLAKEALDLAVAAVKPGVKGSDIHRMVCDFFHDHGHKTQLHKEEGEALVDGYFHATGHGVGLEVHEKPGVGRVESEPLVAGDVIALEPGLYRHGYGGVRLEDLVLVTESGSEVLTNYPYELELS